MLWRSCFDFYRLSRRLGIGGLIVYKHPHRRSHLPTKRSVLNSRLGTGRYGGWNWFRTVENQRTLGRRQTSVFRLFRLLWSRWRTVGTTFFNNSLGRNNTHKAVETLLIVAFVASSLQTREDFPSCGSISTPRCAFQRSARGMLATPALFGILNKFYVEMYLFCFPKSPTDILK